MKSKGIIKFLDKSLTHADCILQEATGQWTDAQYAVSIDAIVKLMESREVWVILPVTSCSWFETHLPQRAEAQWLKMLPFALKDELAADAASLYFKIIENDATQKIIVINKALLKKVKALAGEHRLDMKVVLPISACMQDFDDKHYAVYQNEVVLNVDSSLTELTQYALDSLPSNTVLNLTAKAYPLEVLARNAENNLHYNLLETHKKQAKPNPWLSVKSAISVVAVMAFIYPLTLFINVKLMQHKISTVDKSIAGQYFKLFPNATTVVAPQFRVEKLLQTQHKHGMSYLTHLAVLSKVLQAHTRIHIQKINYKNNQITLSLGAMQFKDLHDAMNAIQQQGVNIKQTTAQSTHNGVQAQWLILNS